MEESWKISEDTLDTDNLINQPEYENIAEELRSKLNVFEKGYVNL